MSTAAWLAIAVVMFIFEAITVGLVCIWFSFGALGAFAVSFLTKSIVIQLVVFIIVSGISFMLVRPLMKKAMPKKDNTNSTNRLIGKAGKVTEDINKDMGRVIVGDISWPAKSVDGSVISQGTMVKIIRTESNILIVEKED